MPDGISTDLTSWSNFYIMIGGAAAALTGLMFVVITLVRDQDRKTTDAGVATFSTPTVAHFCAALLVSAILIAPWHSTIAVAILVAIVGVCGVAYTVRVMMRTKSLTSYSADAEDWAWYNIMPFVAYGVLLSGGAMLFAHARFALFAVAGAAALLIFIGIRNAWDTVTYMAIQASDEPPKAGS
jgi:F0F1-type ATP synthase assembly protein I